MTKKNDCPKKTLIHNIIDELNKDNIPQKCLKPVMQYVKDYVKPYFIIHIVIQLIIIGLLIYLLMHCNKH